MHKVGITDAGVRLGYSPIWFGVVFVILIELALALPCAGSTAQTYSETHLNVVGNLGITTQYKDLEKPFWLTVIPQASGSKVTAHIKPWNEMGLKGP